MAKIRKTDAEWRALLTPEQYEVARKKGTERAFSGEYWDNHAPGTYRCVCCGTPLFDADDQVRLRHRLAELLVAADRRTRCREEADDSWFMRRTEVVCAACDAHLGHVFDDGPGADRPALLPQLRRAQVRAEGLTPARCACCWPRTTR